MAEPTSLISLGELSKPATTLIEKISEAIGGISRPYQTRRVAEAEADAAIIRAQAEIQINDLQRRAMHRFVIEEGQKQENIESITKKALPQISSEAKPEAVENDWIANFFDKSRLVSDQDMQALWARLLAGEANTPGAYSKRTVGLLSSMDKAEAELFRKLCSFVWNVGGLTPLIYDALDPIYTSNGITFSALKHLDMIGLISFEALSGFNRVFQFNDAIQWPLKLMTSYYGDIYTLSLLESQLPKVQGGSGVFDIGKVFLTTPGMQLALIAGSTPDENFRAYILERWKTYNVEHIGANKK